MALELKYFVLNPRGSDAKFAAASRAAMRSFANEIAESDKELAEQLRTWADSCSPALEDTYIDYNQGIEEWPLP